MEGKWEKTYQVTESLLNLSLTLHMLIISNNGSFRLGQILLWPLKSFFLKHDADIINLHNNHLGIKSKHLIHCELSSSLLPLIAVASNLYEVHKFYILSTVTINVTFTWTL